MGVSEVYVQRMTYFLNVEQPPGLMSGQALFDDFDSTANGVIVEAEQAARELGVTLRASGATDLMSDTRPGERR